MASDKKVLVVGAGRVASPLVEYLYRDKSVGITVACEQIELADDISRQYPGVDSTYLNASERSSALQVRLDHGNVLISKIYVVGIGEDS